MAGLSDFFLGKPGGMQQVSTMTGGQNQLLQQLLQGLSGGGVGGGAMGAGMQNIMDLLSNNPEAFQAFQAPYMRQFSEQTVPSLAERFSSLGSGAQGSSAFGQQMGGAAAGLSEQLAALRGQLQQGAMSNLQNILGQGLQSRSFENVYRPQGQGFLQGIAPGIGSAIGGAATGGMGSGLSALMNLFKSKPMSMPTNSTQGPYGSWTPGQYNMYTDTTG